MTYEDPEMAPGALFDPAHTPADVIRYLKTIKRYQSTEDYLMAKPTSEELQKVHAYDCEKRGYHDWRFPYEDFVPESFWCGHCGLKVYVTKEEQ